jgi:histidinol phosphatase-like PHP family hydrolase
MKIAYISPIYFSDVDLSYLSHAQKELDITYFTPIISNITKGAAFNLQEQKKCYGIYPAIQLYPELEKFGHLIDLNKFKDQIDEFLTLAAKTDKALEINTAALRQPLNKLSPEVDILKRFKELGGKYVSVGSDAHYTEHLAADIDMAYSAALEAGFDSITFFQKRIPLQMKIEMER